MVYNRNSPKFQAPHRRKVLEILLIFKGKFYSIKIVRSILRSKIHKAIVTDAQVQYVGSITIDEDLIEKVGLWPGEKVLVASNTSGQRIETYVLAGPRGSGVICMNGAAAHRIKKGEEIIIMGFELSEKPLEPKIILVDRSNRFVKYL